MNKAFTLTQNRPALYGFFLLGFCAYFAVGFAVLAIGQPHEDAYILFKYVNNLLGSGAIVFNVADAPTEGATDFLWFMLVSAVSAVTGDPAIAALLLNAAGFGLVLTMLYAHLARLKNAALSTPEKLVYTLFAAALLVSGTTVSGFTGFSTTLYSALALAIFSLLYVEDETYKPFVPLLGIVIGLFRPDGVIIGVIATLVALFQLRRSQRLKPFWINCAIAVVVGLSYFAWRYWYFGNLLPLPLYVKSQTEGFLPGSWFNERWLKSIWPVLLVATVYLLTSVSRLRQFILAYLPHFALFTALLFAHQSQNWGWRFQAPLFIPIFAVALMGLMQVRNSLPGRAGIAIALLLFAYVFWTGYARETLEYVHTQDYMEKFPSLVSDVLVAGDKVAISEAGRLPYYTGAHYSDMIGLNHNYLAQNAVTAEWLAELAPDVVMVHEAELLAFPDTAHWDAVHAIDARTLRSWIEPEYAAKEFKALTKERQASHAVIEFLNQNPDYGVYLVRFGAGYEHMYAINKNYRNADTVLSQLRASFAVEKLSYCQLQGCLGWKGR